MPPLRRNLGVISLGIPLVKRLGNFGRAGWWPVARIRRALGSFPFLLLLILPFASFHPLAHWFIKVKDAEAQADPLPRSLTAHHQDQSITTESRLPLPRDPRPAI